MLHENLLQERTVVRDGTGLEGGKETVELLMLTLQCVHRVD